MVVVFKIDSNSNRYRSLQLHLWLWNIELELLHNFRCLVFLMLKIISNPKNLAFSRKHSKICLIPANNSNNSNYPVSEVDSAIILWANNKGFMQHKPKITIKTQISFSNKYKEIRISKIGIGMGTSNPIIRYLTINSSSSNKDHLNQYHNLEDLVLKETKNLILICNSSCISNNKSQIRPQTIKVTFLQFQNHHKIKTNQVKQEEDHLLIHSIKISVIYLNY